MMMKSSLKTGLSFGLTSGVITTLGLMDACHAAELYRKLEEKVLPCFYKDRDRFVEIMRHAIALNGAFFNTQRMVAQYLHNAYRLGKRQCSRVGDWRERVCAIPHPALYCKG